MQAEILPFQYLFTVHSLLNFPKDADTGAVWAVWFRWSVANWSEMDHVSACPYGWNDSAHQFKPVHSKYCILSNDD